MTSRNRSMGVVISLLAIVSLALMTLASTAVKAAAPQRAGHSHAHAKACAKPNTAKGTVKFSDWQFPDTLNLSQSNLAVTQSISNAISDGIFLVNDKAHLFPQMVTAVPSLKNGGIKSGGKIIVLHLKHGLRWSNGAATTSADFKFGLAVGNDKDSGPACSGSCDVISRIDTPDKYTAVLHIKQVYAAVLAYGINALPVLPVSWPGAWAKGDVHAATAKQYLDSKFNYEGPDFPTNGAYQVAPGGFVQNDRIVLRPMKYYAGMNCGGYVKNLIFAFYASKPGMEAAAASGGTDITGISGGGYTLADLPQLKQHTDAYKIYFGGGFSFEHLEFNLDPTYNGKPNPVADKNVRLALALALDKIGLIRSALGVDAKTARNLVAWTAWVNTPLLVQPFADKKITGQWDPLAKKYVNSGSAQAVSDAKKLLAKTPYASGFEVDFYTTSGNPVRQAQESVIASNWAKIGVTVKPNFIPASTLFADWAKSGTLHHGAFDVAMFGFTGQPDPDQLKYNAVARYCDRKATVHASINGNDACIANATIDKAFKDGAKTFDSKLRQKAYSIVQAQMNQNAYWVPLYTKPSISTNNGHVLNYKPNPTQFGSTWNAYAWKAKS